MKQIQKNSIADLASVHLLNFKAENNANLKLTTLLQSYTIIMLPSKSYFRYYTEFKIKTLLCVVVC